MRCSYGTVDFHDNWLYRTKKGYTNVQQFWFWILQGHQTLCLDSNKALPISKVKEEKGMAQRLYFPLPLYACQSFSL